MKTQILSAAIAAALTFSTMGCMSSGGALNSEYLLSGAAKAAQAMSISDEQIAQLVHQSVEQMDAKNTLLPASNPYSQRLARITQGITQVDGIPLNFAVYQTNEVNAFACADGSVRVYTGLMDLMNDDEVLGVIGHEVGHVAHHDSKNAYKQALLNSALLDGLSSMGGEIAALTSSQLAQLGEAAISAKYSRSQESNADDYGYTFLRQHGKNPWAMVHAFEKLKSLEGNSSTSSVTQQMFSSHPDTEARIEAMKKRCIADGIAENATSAKTSTSISPSTHSTPTSTTEPPQNVKSISVDDLFKH
ncbi:MAG: M48 family metallopeptidase [Bacteroidales bacterium]|nr:M48 family metallopeptidase [Bacteroidales bacterium]